MPVLGFEEWELIRKKSCARDRSWMNVFIMLWMQKSSWEWGSCVVEIEPEAENTVTVSHCKAIAKICVLRHLVVSDSATPWMVARQAPLSMGLSKQEYWSGLPFLLQGIFPIQGSTINLSSKIYYHV